MHNRLGIILFFSAIAYALTYPYELSYKGNKDVKLIEESYKYTSLDDIINKPEFKGKVLFIRVGYPFDVESNLPEHELMENKIIVLEDGKKYLIYSKDKPHKYQEQVLSEMSNHYKDKDIEFVFLHINHYNNYKDVDNIRKWKSFIKKHQIRGNHLLMPHKLYTKMRDVKRPKKSKRIFPYNLIVDKNGIIVNNDALSPVFEKEKLYAQLDSVLNGFVLKTKTEKSLDSISPVPQNNSTLNQ